MKNPIVEVKQGKLLGVLEKNCNGNNFYAFRGIPYAESPVGDLKFKDPVPKKSWSGVKNVTKYGNKCAQINWFSRKITGECDCLFLNVYTMELNPANLKAVMVLIHGGNFAFGSGNDDINGPDHLVEKDIILVTINYRLGILGFLNLDDEEAPGNQGLKDQVMALEWIQQNISRFGGDPNNVTIFGYSAGSAAVHYLTLSPRAQGLFHKAILQSGVATNPWASVSVDSMKKTVQEIVLMLGTKITNPKELIKYLRETDVNLLLEAESKLTTWKDRFSIINKFGPSVDIKSKNPFLDISIEEAVKTGINVPCIIGITNDESIIVIRDLDESQLLEIDNHRDSLFNPQVLDHLKKLNISTDDLIKFYMGDKKINFENRQSFVNLISMTNFLMNIYEVIDIQRQEKTINTSMYFYKFDYYSKSTSQMQKILSTDLIGTCHCEEVGYFFNMKCYKKIGIEPPIRGTTEYFIQKNFIELWTTFAKTGNPNPKSSDLITIEWKPIDDSTEYNCLKISNDIKLIKQENELQRVQKNVK